MNRIISAHTPDTPNTEGTTRDPLFNSLFDAYCTVIAAILETPNWTLYWGAGLSKG